MFCQVFDCYIAVGHFSGPRGGIFTCQIFTPEGRWTWDPQIASRVRQLLSYDTRHTSNL